MKGTGVITLCQLFLNEEMYPSKRRIKSEPQRHND